MVTVKTEALLTPICDAQHQESQDEEIRNVGEIQENEVEAVLSEDATPEIQDTACSRAARRKGGGVVGVKLSGRNAAFRGKETRTVH